MNHRTALVSAMSIAGVAVAGATALGANLGILNGTDDLGQLSPVTPEPTSTTLDSGVTTPSAAADLAAYQINGVGVVTLSRDGGHLGLASADVGSWGYEVKRQGEVLEMAFRNGDREIQFEARVTQGQIVVDVWEDRVIEAPANPGTAATTQGTVAAPTATVTAPSSSAATWDDHDDSADHTDLTWDDSDHSGASSDD